MKRSEFLEVLEQELYAEGLVPQDTAPIAAKVALETVLRLGMQLTRQIDPGDPHSRRVVENFEPECDKCGTHEAPIQKMGGMVCSNCRTVICF